MESSAIVKPDVTAPAGARLGASDSSGSAPDGRVPGQDRFTSRNAVA
jgi:hypothetical protein